MNLHILKKQERCLSSLGHGHCATCHQVGYTAKEGGALQSRSWHFPRDVTYWPTLQGEEAHASADLWLFAPPAHDSCL